MGSGRVLVVEDPLVRRLIEGIFVRAGFAVTQAEPQRALALLDDTQRHFELLITNVPELFADRGFDLPVLYIAASPDPQWLLKFPLCRALQKPFHPRQLLDLAHELLVASRARAGGLT